VNDLASVHGDTLARVVDRKVTVAAAKGPNGATLTDGHDYFLRTEGDAFAGIQGGRAVTGAKTNVAMTQPSQARKLRKPLPPPTYSPPNSALSSSSHCPPSTPYAGTNTAIAHSTKAQLANDIQQPDTDRSVAATNGYANAYISDRRAVAVSGSYRGLVHSNVETTADIAVRDVRGDDAVAASGKYVLKARSSLRGGLRKEMLALNF
jgi:hypothetical protein